MSPKKIAVDRSKAVSISTLLILGIVFVSLNNNSSIAFAKRHFGMHNYGENRNYLFGAISSVQDGNDRQPAWILTRFWKTNMLNHTTQINNANSSAGGEDVLFSASFRMIMTNGSAMHTHTITNFVLKNKSMPNKSTTVFNGTASASLKEGIVPDVPASIKVMNDRVISIWLDPAKVKNHYGNTPIFGIVFSKHEI